MRLFFWFFFFWTIPVEKKPEPTIGTAQRVSGPKEQANQNKPTGMRTEPMMAGGSLASGAARPPGAAVTAAAYRLLSSMAYRTPSVMPTATPMKARPPMPGDQPRTCWNTMGKAGNIMYNVPICYAGGVSFLVSCVCVRTLTTRLLRPSPEDTHTHTPTHIGKGEGNPP